MADLGGQQIQDTYNGLVKKADSTTGFPVNGRANLEDGDGNTLAIELGQTGRGAKVNGNLDVDGNINVSDDLYTNLIECEEVEAEQHLTTNGYVSAPLITSPYQDPVSGDPETELDTSLILRNGTYIEASAPGTSIKADRINGASVDPTGNTTIELQSNAVLASSANVNVGIRTANPNSALDVNGTIRANSLNIKDQDLFLPPYLDYIRMKKYGQGQFFGLGTGEDRFPKYTLGVNQNGVLVEDIKSIVVKIQGNGFDQLNSNPVEILPTKQFAMYDIRDVITLKTGDALGNWVQADTGRQDPYAIGQFDGLVSTGAFRQFWSMALHVCNTAGQTLYNPSRTTTPNTPANAINRKNRGLWLYSRYPDRIVSGSTNQVHYIMIRYKELNVAGTFLNNVDITIGQ